MRPRKFRFDDSRLNPEARGAIARWRANLPADAPVIIDNYRPLGGFPIFASPLADGRHLFYADLAIEERGGL